MPLFGDKRRTEQLTVVLCVAVPGILMAKVAPGALIPWGAFCGLLAYSAGRAATSLAQA